MLLLMETRKDRLRMARTAKDLTMREVGKLMGKSEASVSRWEQQDVRDLDVGIVEQLAEIYDVSPNYLAGFDDDPTPKAERCMIPVLGKIPAGTPTTAVEYREGIIEVPKHIVDRFGRADLFALKIKGDSMSRVLPDGVIGIFARSEFINNGAIVAVTVNGEDATVKRFLKTEDGVVILKPESYNTAYEPKAFNTHADDRFRILGQLVLAMMLFV